LFGEKTMSEHNDENNDERTKLKNVTIRGIDSDTYEEFSHKIKNMQMNIGDAVTRMMQQITTDIDESLGELPGLSARRTFRKFRLPRGNISHHDHMSISKQDLEDANARFSFSHIGELTIESDVTMEVFRKYIRTISHCDRVKVPSVLPKLMIYAKINFCDRIEIYEVEKVNSDANEPSKKHTSLSDDDPTFQEE
jgi:hypothetical protein